MAARQQRELQRSSQAVPARALEEFFADEWYRQEEQRLWDAEIEEVIARQPNPEPLESSEGWEIWAKNTL